MINVAVCDDEPIHRRDAEKRVERILHAEGIAFRLLMFSSAEELLARTEVGEWQPEIAVLDIEMDGEDGISLARKLNEKIPACRIIFFTGSLPQTRCAPPHIPPAMWITHRRYMWRSTSGLW